VTKGILSSVDLATLVPGLPPFTQVVCGARAERGSPLVDGLPEARFVGFEPEREGFAGLAARSPRYRFFDSAVAGTRGTRTLYVTRAPEASSLLVPRADYFRGFTGCGGALEVVRQVPIETVTLDEFLPAHGIDRIDDLQLDAQGTELEILRGAERFLQTTITTVRVEVEFAPLYEEQPLFADVDTHLRERGFILFDLRRHHYRLEPAGPYVRTHGQLLWGDAIYFKDAKRLAAPLRRAELTYLFCAAAHNGFADYALSVLNGMALATGDVGVRRVLDGYCSFLAREAGRLQTLSHARGIWRLRRWAGRLTELLRDLTEKTRYSWSD
jgi:FkbM family methyltransferase